MSVRHNRDRLGKIHQPLIEKHRVAPHQTGAHLDSVRGHDLGIQFGVDAIDDGLILSVDEAFREGRDAIRRVNPHPGEGHEMRRIPDHRHPRGNRVAATASEPGHEVGELLSREEMPAGQGMDSIMLPIHDRIAEPRQLLRDGSAQLDRHHLIVQPMDQVDRRVPEILQERKQHVIQPARHRGKTREPRRMVDAD